MCIRDREFGPVSEKTLFKAQTKDQLNLKTLGIGIYARSGASTVELSNDIKKKIKEVKTSLPDGLDLRVAFNRANYVEAAIEEVYKTLLIAFILVVIIIYLFLGNLKAVIVPAIALPVSLIATFLGIYLFDLSINIFDKLQIPFDFVGERPTGLIISLISSIDNLLISYGLSAILKSFGVVLLTLTSVLCADNKTAIRIFYTEADDPLYKKIIGKDPNNQIEIDKILIDFDGTDDKSSMGANSILAISLANSHVAAKSKGLNLYEHFSKIYSDITGENVNSCIPMPMFNILNGGEHAYNNIDIQ